MHKLMGLYRLNFFCGSSGRVGRQQGGVMKLKDRSGGLIRGRAVMDEGSNTGAGDGKADSGWLFSSSKMS